MKSIKTFEGLKSFSITSCLQYWYYVIIVNPRDMTRAGKAVFDNLNIFHLDSSEVCYYFIPGFENFGKGLFHGLFNSLKNDYINIPGFGKLSFFEREFVEFYRELESSTYSGCSRWRYSGECELLLFTLNEDGKIDSSDFASYNLDDIVRNGRNVSEFIRTTINVDKDATNRINAKSILDEKFYEMIMPDMHTVSTASHKRGWDILCQNGFVGNSYYFISYSTKDYHSVSAIRDKLR